MVILGFIKIFHYFIKENEAFEEVDTHSSRVDMRERRNELVPPNQYLWEIFQLQAAKKEEESAINYNIVAFSGPSTE